MILVDIDTQDVKNYTNKDGLIAISDLVMLSLTDDRGVRNHRRSKIDRPTKRRV